MWKYGIKKEKRLKECEVVVSVMMGKKKKMKRVGNTIDAKN